MTAQRLVIIDGYGLFFRAYFATAKSQLTAGNSGPVPNATEGAPVNNGASSVTATGALHGFIHSLLKLMADGVLCAGQPILVALDRAGKDSPRHQIYPQYKAHRRELPSDLCAQLALFPSLLEAFGLTHIAHQGAEADDIIASYAKMALTHGCHEVVVISSDKDLMQLVDDGKVVIYDYLNEKNIDSQAVFNKMGVVPKQIVDYLALIGDSSDNIPGVRGIGQKGAGKLLQEFSSLENIYANLENIKGKTRDMLEQGRENAFLSYKLASLNYELPITHSLEQLTWAGLQEHTLDIAQFLESFAMHRALAQFKRLCARLPVNPPRDAMGNNMLNNSAKSAANSSLLEQQPNSTPSVTLADDNAPLAAITQPPQPILALTPSRLLAATSAAIELTTGTTAEDNDTKQESRTKLELHGDIVQEAAQQRNDNSGASNAQINAYSSKALQKNAILKRYISLYLDKSQKKSIKILIGFPNCWQSIVFEDGTNSLDNTLRDLLERDDILKICTNCEDIFNILRKNGVLLRSYDDIGILAYSIEAGRVDCNDVIQLIGEFGRKLETELASTQKATTKATAATPSAINTPDPWQILGEIRHCYNKLMAELTSEGRLSLYLRLDREVLYRLRRMESNGIAVDLNYLQELKAEFSKKLTDISEKIFDEARMSFNIASPKQVAEVLYKEMSLGTHLEEYVKRGFISRSKSNSTASEILEILASQGFTIAENILEWRQYAKLLGTYVEGLIKAVDPHDGRVHCRFHAALTNTGRISASEPNLQSIPIRGKEGSKLRRVFVAKPGFMLISVDYSQIEMRILAHIGKIASLQAMFASGQDIHRITASEVFKVPLTEVTPTLRSRAKAINFGIIYGISGFGLARNLGIDIREAQDYIQKYLATHPGIEQYMQKTIEFAHRYGYVETLLGHRCHIANIDSSNKVLRQMAERTAINAPIQGSAADIIRKVIASLPEDLMQYLSLQIHDELLFEVPETQASELAPRIKAIMALESLGLEVPLETELRIGKTWDLPK